MWPFTIWPDKTGLTTVIDSMSRSYYGQACQGWGHLLQYRYIAIWMVN